jgi:hypothetical protein
MLSLRGAKYWPMISTDYSYKPKGRIPVPVLRVFLKSLET